MPADFLLRYFDAEKQESLLFVAVGIAAIVASLYVLRRARRWRGMVAPLVAIAAIQLVVGATVFLRTGAQVAALQRQLDAAPATFKVEEGERMKTVLRNFDLYRSIELALLAAGIAVTLGLRRREYWRGFGLALALQSAFMLVLDRYAEARAQVYVAALLAL
ncbi:MAG TPA: hypothetical protein VF319_13715 [Caldimonas sp.]